MCGDGSDYACVTCKFHMIEQVMDMDIRTIRGPKSSFVCFWRSSTHFVRAA